MEKPAELCTIQATRQALLAGKLTVRQLVEQCLLRIERLEPTLQAWAHIATDRALHLADLHDQQLSSGQPVGVLHGMPIGIKDIIDVQDMPTSCGTTRWADSISRSSASVVTKLEAAGALILGKTVTTPYAYLDPPQTRNPWDHDRTPGGSSSGSAVAVATGMCLAALGTQTGGSLTRPASYCGVLSFKPSWGNISTDHILPLSPLLDHVGVVGRSIADIRDIYGIVKDSKVTELRELSVQQPPRNIEFCFLDGYFATGLEVVLRRTIQKFQEQFREALQLHSGHVVQETVNTEIEELFPAQKVLFAVAAAQLHCQRLSMYPDEYPAKIQELIVAGKLISNPEWEQAVRFRELQRQHWINRAAGRIFITAATKDLPPDRTTTGDPGFNSPWSFLGFPTISIPIAWSGIGLPMAIQLIASPEQESELFAAAAWIESQFAQVRDIKPEIP